MSVEGIVKEIGGLTQLSQWSPDNLINAAQKVARELKGFGDTALETQTYKILAAVRKLELREVRARKAFQPGWVKLLRPKLAYAVSRKEQLYPFFQVLDAAIGKISEEKDFAQLLSFTEAVIAYHQYEEVRQRKEKEKEKERGK